MTAHLFDEYAERIEAGAQILPLDDKAMAEAKGSVESILQDTEDLLARIKACGEQYGLCEYALDFADQAVDELLDERNKAAEVMKDAGHVLDNTPYRRLSPTHIAAE